VVTMQKCRNIRNTETARTRGTRRRRGAHLFNLQGVVRVRGDGNGRCRTVGALRLPRHVVLGFDTALRPAAALVAAVPRAVLSRRVIG
jgi:hypothetical protein